MMRKIKTIGVVDGGGDAGALNTDIRGVARTASSAASVRGAGAALEGRA